MRNFILIFLAACFSYLFCTCEEKKQDFTDWDAFVEDFIAIYFELNPTDAVDAGLHQYDGEFPDLSQDGIQTLIDWLHVQKDSLSRYNDELLTKKQQFEKQYLDAIIDKKLFWLESARTPFKNPAFYLGTINPSVYLTREYAPLDARMKAFIHYANNLPDVLKLMKSNLELPLPHTYAELGRSAFRGYTSFFSNDVPKIFESVDNEELQQEFSLANEGAIKAVKQMEEWFDSILPESNGSFALGKEKFKEMLWATERIDISIEELKEAALKDFERNLNDLTEACSKLMPGISIPECLKMVSSNKPTGGAVQGAKEQLESLKKFLIDKDIISIKGDADALVDEAPPYNRWNFAYINIPGTYEDELPSIYYIAPPDPSWPPKVQKGYVPSKTKLLFISVHEVWPGHFLHSLHRNKSEYNLAKVFWGYAYGEGWAHYTEEMMYDEGLGNFEPEYKIGQLENALLRNGRFLSAIGLHTEGMTVQESEKMFIEKGYINTGDAKQQAARGTFDPAYLNYTMGKLMIMKLKEDWLKENPDNTLKDFHDTFLSYGGPPIPMVRKDMLATEDGSLF
ncbi:MAG: DUF885 domain-containing protein [Ignavibacterium sp.]|nr:MAG: DUF885 domain-containing protein [Ignavibacterium sp.]